MSTIDDYLAFGQMMLGKGKLGRERILSRPTVEAMITDQLTADQKADSAFALGFWESRGWGFRVSIVTATAGRGRPIPRSTWRRSS